MYNKVILMGRLTRDPELKSTTGGRNVCSFSIAVDRRFQKKGEDKKSDFFNIVAWGEQADFVCRWFTKGRCILVEGELQNRSYMDKDNREVRITEVIADRLSFTGEKSQGGSYSETYTGAPAPSAPPQAAQAPAASAPASSFAGDDDYPF